MLVQTVEGLLVVSRGCGQHGVEAELAEVLHCVGDGGVGLADLYELHAARARTSGGASV